LLTSAVLLLAALVLAGWVLDNPLLKGAWPGQVAMKANTAVGLALAAITLWLLACQTVSIRRQRVTLGCALVIVALGVVTLAEYLLRTDLGIDQLLFRDLVLPAGTSNPGRMAPEAAVNFVLLGAALVCMPRQRLMPAAQGLAVLVALIGLFNLIGYIYGTTVFYGFGPYTPIAMTAAAGFMALGVGVLCSRPDLGLMRPITSELPGGLIVRRLLVAVIGLPVALDWLALTGERAGLFGSVFGEALSSVTSGLMLMILVWLAAKAL